jgi:S-DNA-T family DNA segregation ATPase FtsK/SpoIIIE
MALSKVLGDKRKQEILGFLLIVLAIFVLISLATHKTADYKKMDQVVTWDDLFHLRISNSAGILGTLLSQALLWALGRSVFVLPLLMILAGWRFVFRFEGKNLRQKILLALVFVFALGTLVFLLRLDNPNVGADLTTSLSGKLGLYIAGFLKTLVGVTGGFALLAAIMIVTFFSVVPYRPKNVKEKLTAASSAVGDLIKSAKSGMAGLLDSAKSRARRSEKIDSEWEMERRRQQEIMNPPDEKESRDDLEDEEEDEEDEEEQSTQPAAKRSSVKPTTHRRRTRRNGQTIELFPEHGGPGEFQRPMLSFLEEPPRDSEPISRTELAETSTALQETLKTFGIDIVPGTEESFPGPVITRYEFKPAPGIKINQIVNLSDDLALALKASRIRIVAPVPGKAAVGVEIPNRQPQMVFIKEILTSRQYQQGNQKLPLALGKDAAGNPVVADLAKMPHLLIAGATGAGKSVCLNVLITSLLYRHSPDSLRFILVDPKILELSVYSNIPYLARPVVNKSRMAETVLAIAVQEMDERYKKLAKQSVRSIDDFNAKAEPEERLPYLVIIVDELADMMMSSNSAKVELLITRLAQMARAVGIHLILATQRPSVDVITGLIKANFSSRVAFQVASKVDSRTILDANGAEKLLGNGDMLFLYPGAPEPQRIHGAWISSQETERIVDFLREHTEEAEPIENFTEEKQNLILERSDRDVLMPEATELVIRHKQGSVSLLQRRLGIGYQRAARIMDQLEAAGVVGPADGSKARDVLVDQTYLEKKE